MLSFCLASESKVGQIWEKHVMKVRADSYIKWQTEWAGICSIVIFHIIYLYTLEHFRKRINKDRTNTASKRNLARCQRDENQAMSNVQYTVYTQNQAWNICIISQFNQQSFRQEVVCHSSVMSHWGFRSQWFKYIIFKDPKTWNDKVLEDWVKWTELRIDLEAIPLKDSESKSCKLTWDCWISVSS